METKPFFTTSPSNALILQFHSTGFTTSKGIPKEKETIIIYDGTDECVLIKDYNLQDYNKSEYTIYKCYIPDVHLLPCGRDLQP